MTVLPSYKYGNPLQVLINKESAIENRIRDWRGCKHLSFDASGDKVYASCARGRKVGRKGKCVMFKECN